MARLRWPGGLISAVVAGIVLIAAASDCVPARLPPRGAAMTDDQCEVLWDQFVTAIFAASSAQERASLYGAKPALFAGSARSPIWRHRARSICGSARRSGP